MIFVRDETDGVAHGVRAAGASDAVDIVLHMQRKIIVHHVRDAVHVNAAGGDIRRHQHAHRAGFEIFQRAQTLALRTVRVQRGGADAFLLQLAGEAVGGMFHARKNEHHVHAGFVQEMHEQGGLEMFRHFIHELSDSLGGIGAAADLDELGVVLEFVGKPLDLSRERGGEQEGLPFRRQLPHDLPDGGEETHVKHAVRLVEHEKLEAGKICATAAHEVEQTAGAGDDELCAGAEGADLGLFADAAKNGGYAQRQVPRVSPDIFLDLKDEFARGGEDKGAGTARGAADGIGQPGQHGQCEGGGLAGAGLGDADQIMTGDNRRNGLGLDGGGFGVAGFLHGLKDFGIETEDLK